MSKKVSYIEEMTPFKSTTVDIASTQYTLEFKTYKPEPKNCAIFINDEVYEEYTSFDKGIKEYDTISKSWEIMQD